MRTLGLALALLAVATGTAGAASAATLVGGREQAAIDRAFFANRAHAGQAIVSTRASTVAPAWAVVKSVRPRRAGRGHGGAPRLQTTYYHRVRGAERAGRPPTAARADLARPFAVAVVYTGAGRETIAYRQLYDGVCLGHGGFTDRQTDTITPMSWTVRYLVYPDDLRSAVRGPHGPVLVPRVAFMRSRSTVDAKQTLTRTAVDVSCAGKPTRWTCTRTYGLSGGDGLLWFPATGGIEVGVPLRATGVGDCDPADYTLGPSLWDSGATTALVGRLGLVGGRLPRHPDAPTAVSWRRRSAQATDGFVVSPCQGDGAACHDAMRWRGTLRLAPGP